MNRHRVHKERIRFVVSRTGWEVICRKSDRYKSGELAPQIPVPQSQRSQAAQLTTWDQGDVSNG